MTDANREAQFWAVEETECLTHSTAHEAMEMYLDGYEDRGGRTPEDLREAFRALGEVEVTGYAPVEITVEQIASTALDYVLEWLEEHFAGPDGGGHIANQATIDAAKTFAACLKDDYHVWLCEPVTSVKINALEWAEEHEPHWFESEAIRVP